ncbi:type VI secretion system tip protein TssI/VgrG [Achromobacter dolens]|uniref:type VI secretion system Vgr family protein n=1 Tax=Achromobacter dolens TaxID=1287738 RepID=UPI0022B8CCDA|nr:type VI secretion system Vgr family protein [Achromobacter dolens]MCZ8411307.1 type VI secretion system tip protein TssI/VgrG [Achromobacter dolens]
MDSPRIEALAAFVNEIAQRSRLLSLKICANEATDGRQLESLLPQEVCVQEALCVPYRTDVICVATDPGLSLRQMLGCPARITIAGEFAASRLVCGMVTGVTRLGADGSLTAFELRIEPALALLAQRRNARVFQDKSVPQIVQAILNEHIAGNAAIRAAFQHQADLHQDYPIRSYCVQYDEDDLAFITRLLAEEGISYRFEHKETDEGVAQHVLHLVDHEAAFGAQEGVFLRFARDGTLNTAQTLSEWQAGARVSGQASTLVSYDYKLAGTRNADYGTRLNQGNSGDQAASTLEDYAALAPYAASRPIDLERYARLRQQARDRVGKEFTGQGPTLGLAPGQCFTLERHPAHAADQPEQREFRVIGQSLVARNNLPADLEAAGAALLARCARQEQDPPCGLPARPALADTQRYNTRLIAIRRQIPVVPVNAGQRVKRTAPGPQTARVVGPETDVVHTDELGRVRIQFHWQRPAEGASQEQYSTWVRVATASAGDGFGVQFLPRVGDEVLVDFIEHDISRPVVVASLYNGHHAAPRFSGQGSLPGNRVLSGIQTREHRGSGYNELVFDDTPRNPQARLASSAGASALNLGQLVYARRDGQAEPRGRGAELRSDQVVAIRGGHGVLVSAHAQSEAQGVALERANVIGTAQALQSIHASLAQSAQAQDAGGTDAEGVDALVQNLAHWEESPSDTANAAASRPIVAISAPGSTFVSSQQSLTLGAEHHVDLVGAANVQASAGKQLLLRAAETISLMAHSLGMKLIAAAGVLQIRASQGDIEITAGKRIRLVAGTDIEIQAPKVRVVTQGAQTDWAGGVITQASSGAHVIKSASFAQQGPASATVPGQPLAAAPLAADERFVLRLHGSQEVLANRPYRVVRVADGSVVAEGISDDQGRTSLDARLSFDGLYVHATPSQEP